MLLFDNDMLRNDVSKRLYGDDNSQRDGNDMLAGINIRSAGIMIDYVVITKDVMITS